MKNEKGFSLTETTIAIGILGGISLVTMKMVQEQTRNDALLRGRADIQRVTSIIKGSLNDPDTCRHMLRGQSIGPTGSPTNIGNHFSTGQSALYQGIKSPTTGLVTAYRELIRPAAAYPGFRVDTIGLQWQAGSNSAMDVVIGFRIERNGFLDDRNNSNDLIITRRIPVVVRTNAGTVTDCGPVMSDVNDLAKQEFCTSLGSMATWDGTTCNFNPTQCPAGEVPRGMNSDGSLACVPAEERLNPTDLFDTSSTCTISGSRSFRIIETNGRLRVVCY